MADDATDNPRPSEDEATAAGDPAPVRNPSVHRQPRSRESWEPQQRETKKPDFISRLAKTSDMPVEIAKERQKSKLGEHRLAALRWEEETIEPESGTQSGEQDGEDQAAQPANKVSTRRLAAGAGLGVVVAVLGVMWFAESLLIGGATPNVPPAVPAAGPAGSPSAAPILSEADYSETVDVMRRFLESPTSEDLKATIREPDRVWPLVQAHIERVPWKPFVVRRLPAKNEVQMNHGLLAAAAEVDDYQRIVVAMERTPEGIKIDWETFTGQGEMSWEDFVARRPTTPVLMRVSLRADDYFNVDFPDSTTHACYRLTSHQDTHRFYGYVKRGSPVHAHLATRMRVNPRIMPTLRIRYPENSTSVDQIEITEMVADGWLASEATKVRAQNEEDPAESPSRPSDSPSPK